MIFIVSGEGPSDIGTRNADGSFKPGPMARIIDALVEHVTGNAPLGYDGMEFISEGELARIQVTRRSILTLGNKQRRDTAAHTRFAQQLSIHAKYLTANPNAGPVAAVLFRDTDGTRSTEHGRYEAICDAIKRGFEISDFPHGVAMVPKPKSEAWLICALKAAPYEHCDGLEEALSGNDHSPEPAKAQLTALLEHTGKTVDDLADMVATGAISAFRIDMQSYNRFRERLETVIASMMRS